MADYAITLARSAEKEIERLPAAVIKRVTQKIDQLANDPRPAGCKKLRASRNRWRVRVGDYRIVYAVDDSASVVDITAVRHRRFVYE